MIFFTVLIVFLFIQWWGSPAPLHKDEWFRSWCDSVANKKRLTKIPGSVLVVSVGGPVFLALLLMLALREMNYWLQVLAAVPLLLYSLGRGQYTRRVLYYINAWRAEDRVAAMECIENLSTERGEAFEELAPDWPSMHQRMLQVVAYRGFERLFAPLFWFVVLGPVGALLYRLSALYLDHHRGHDREEAERWLWLMEWPAARVLGLAYAFTGNFVGCFQALSATLWDGSLATGRVVANYIKGALGLSDERMGSAALSEQEFKAVLSLHRRTLIFWICVIALANLFF